MSFYINLNDSVPQYTPKSPLVWTLKHPQASIEMFGFLPSFLDEADPRTAAEQFQERYAHGGGWEPFQVGKITVPNLQGFQFLPNGNLKYPGDPQVHLLGEARLHNKETIRIYEFAWVAIIQDNGYYGIMRMD